MNFQHWLSLTSILIAVIGLLIILALARFLTHRKPVKLNPQKFQTRWVEVQKLCAHADTWPLAIINADKLLDDALRKAHYKGKTMGERLVAAQRDLSENDGVWYGHKLRNKLVHEEYGQLKQRDVLRVLSSFRQGLKDLGALK